jgi:LPXTG-motif cell wall-anchored protein
MNFCSKSARLLALTGIAAASVTVSLAQEPAKAATYTVTSTSCTGPGSLAQAIIDANLNPGLDTISITPDLQIGPIGATTCGAGPVNDDKDFYMFTITDDVVIQGNGARLLGAQRWIKFDGNPGLPGECPTTTQIPSLVQVIAETPGFAKIENAAEVTVEGMTFRNLSAFVRMADGTALHLESSTLSRILDWSFSCLRPAIVVAPSGAQADIVVKDSVVSEVFNDGDNFQNFWEGTAILGKGNLDITGSVFELGKGVVQWQGGTVDVVSSQFRNSSGWMHVQDSTANIVNSAFGGGTGYDANSRIRAQDSVVNITASSFSVGELDCNEPCFPWELSEPGLFVAAGSSTINFSQSAVGVLLSKTLNALVLFPNLSTNIFGADDNTWIQPVPGQSATELRSTTDQSNLLTDPPGLPTLVSPLPSYPQTVTPLLGTPGDPGKLIDVIADSQCGGANQLLSPIDNSCITEDALGNSRWDTGNNARNIGAVQLTLSPHLVVAGTGDGTVELSWSQPLDPSSGAITGYGVLYRVLGSSDPFTRIDIAGPDTLEAAVAGLTNGTTYEFEVVAVNAVGDGPPGNVVNATPSTTPQAPDLTATPGDGRVDLSWTTPPDGGAAIEGYIVQYRPVGATDWQTAPDSGTDTSTTIAGLTNGTPYEFRVAAVNANGVGAYGDIAQATPETTPTSTSTPTTTVPPTSTPATTEPANSTPTTTVPATLPETGSEAGSTAMIAALLVLVGAAMVVVRRRPTT